MSIQIKLVSAVLTHDTETFSNMDPYCTLKLGQQTFRSKTKEEAGKRPVWNESFTFNAQENILKITVMDQDTASDDLIGEGTLDLSKFRNNPSEQHQMVQLNYKGKAAGKVQLVIRATGGNIQNNLGQGNNIANNIVPGFTQGNTWNNSQWGGNNPQVNPYGQQNQWGNNNQNNGWGNYGPPNQFNQGQSNPLGIMGQYIGQQAGNNGQPGLQNNGQMQYQMINGFGMNNPNYGNRPFQ